MFQKSLLKNFIKSFSTPSDNDIVKLVKWASSLEKYIGHVDLNLSFYRLLPYLSSNIYITLENSDDKRVVYGANLDNKRTLLIVIDDDTIVSIFIQNNKNLAKQIKNGRFKKINQLGETTTSLTLNCPAGSCLKAFWRQTDLLELLYQKLSSKSIPQEPFIIELYWDIGEHMSTKTIKDNWGKSVVKELASYIKKQDPTIKGFTDKNLWRMKQFYETYRYDEKVATLWRLFPWSHNKRIKSIKISEYALYKCR